MAICYSEGMSPGRMDSFAWRRIRTIPISKDLKLAFIKQFDVWKRSSGKDWAIERTKALRDSILRSFSVGSESDLPPWFATTRSGHLKGTAGKLFKRAMSGKVQLKAVLFLLNRYTLEYHTPREVDMKKIFMSTSGQDPVQPKGYAYRRVIPALQRLQICHTLRCEAPMPIMSNLVKAGQVDRIPWDIASAYGGKFYDRHPDLLSHAIGGEPLDRDYCRDIILEGGHWSEYHYYGETDEEAIAGSLSVHCQAGCKERYYFAPNLVYQRALDPLKDSLRKVIDSLPWDCTLRQRHADSFVHQAFKEGRRVFSVDLHAATDNFPWWFQKKVLQSLIDRRRYVKGKRNWALMESELLIDLVENGTIEFTNGNAISYVPPFSKGQPLGLGPSFFLFTLSHGLLLFILNGYKHDNAFFVCGDDVLIFDESLYSRYRKVLALWEVGVSELKSFQSSRVAQFTGVTFVDDTQFWVPKWYAPSGDNLLDLAAYWYPGLTSGMRDDALISRILSLPPTYGIGRNPQGLSLDSRMPQTLVNALVEREQIREERPRPRDLFLDYSKLRRQLLRNGKISEDFVLGLTSQIQLAPEYHMEAVSSRYTTFICGLSFADWYDRMAAQMDGTDVSGFPSTRNGEKFDPYSLGTTRSWSRLFKQADEACAAADLSISPAKT